MGRNNAIQITQEKISEASWELLESIGIEEFSMRKLADQLNIQAASLYWYFKSKQSIFQFLADEVAKEILLSVKQEGDWKEQLYNFATNIRYNFKKFPCSAQLFMKTLPSGAQYIKLMNSLLKTIDHINLSDKQKFSSIACLWNYVISFEVDIYEQNRLNLKMQEDAQIGSPELFKQFIKGMPAKDFDVMQRMHNNDIFNEIGSDSMFETGLNILIMGIEQLTLK